MSSFEAQELAVDKDGKVLVWVADEDKTASDSRRSRESGNPTPSQSPAAYTPPHLAERILAEHAATASSGSE